jgi:hypothetical protein
MLWGDDVTVTEAREVVEHYMSMGLSLRRHPFALMRHDLVRQKIATCADVLAAREAVAGLVPQ